MLPPCTAVAPCWTKTSSTRGSTSLQGSKACLWCSSYSSCWGTCSLPESCYTYTHRVIACCLIAGLFTNLVSAGTSPPRLSQGWRMLLGGSLTIWRRSMSARSALRLWTCCCASRGCWLASSTWVSTARRTSMDTVSRVFQVSSLADKINWLSSKKKRAPDEYE